MCPPSRLPAFQIHSSELSQHAPKARVILNGSSASENPFRMGYSHPGVCPQATGFFAALRMTRSEESSMPMLKAFVHCRDYHGNFGNNRSHSLNTFIHFLDTSINSENTFAHFLDESINTENTFVRFLDESINAENTFVHFLDDSINAENPKAIRTHGCCQRSWWMNSLRA